MAAGIFHGPRATRVRGRVHDFVTGLPDGWHEYRDSWHDRNRRPRRIGEVVVFSLALTAIGVPVALDTGKPAGHELRLDPGGKGQGGKAGGAPVGPPPLGDRTPSPFASSPAAGGDWRGVNTGGQPGQDSSTLHCSGIDQRGVVGGVMDFRPHVDALSGASPNPNNVWTVVGELGPSGKVTRVARGMGAVVNIDVPHSSILSVSVVDGNTLAAPPASVAAMHDLADAGAVPPTAIAWCPGKYGINY